MAENRRREQPSQVRPLKVDAQSLPGSAVLNYQLIDTQSTFAPEICVHFIGPRNLDAWLHMVLDSLAECLTCGRTLELNRESQADCRAIAAVPAEGTGKYVSGVCACCFAIYGGLEETKRMVAEKILSDLQCDGSYMTDVQYEAELKRARRQAKHRR